MAIFYVVGCLIILGSNISVLPESIMLVIKQAFTPTAVIGGFAGATVRMAIQNGVARGVFSNESGLGSAPIAAAAAKTKILCKTRLSLNDRNLFRYYCNLYYDWPCINTTGGMEV